MNRLKLNLGKTRLLIAIAATAVVGVSIFMLESREETPQHPVLLRLVEHMRKNATSTVDQGPVFLQARDGSKILYSGHRDKGSWLESLASFDWTYLTELSVDSVIINFTHNWRDIQPDSNRIFRENMNRGIIGARFTGGTEQETILPTDVIAQNRPLKNEWEIYAGKTPPADKDKLTVSIFDSHQVYISRLDGFHPRTLFRGGRIVALEDMTHDSVKTMASGMVEWLSSQLSAEGRMNYKYWPSRGEYSDSNNMIRQWMASLALVRAMKEESYGVSRDRVKQNVRYNLTSFYKSNGNYGWIEYGNKAKLGAAALAGLTILELGEKEFKDNEEKLFALTTFLQKDDGSFVTFYKPENRNDNQNFYPGETLLYWSYRYEKTKDADLLERFMRAFRFYRDWHRNPKHRNPAFIPWHTQAYFLMWKLTKDPALATFLFEMNDWLLPIQQIEDAPSPDTIGRFYAPNKNYGPPHASSTGVYLEGLIDAFELAKLTADQERMIKYRFAIQNALRSLKQLQFKDRIDMYYISQPERALGGLRTTVYHNEIRVDNIQHGFMGILKTLARFQLDDYPRVQQ